MKREYLVLIIGIILLMLNAFLVGYNLSYSKETINTLSEINYNNSNCSNLDLINTSKCLNSQFKEFFVYNLSQKNSKLTLEQLKKDGGVCSHASKYYSDNANDLGFFGTTCSFNVSKENGTITVRHQIAIISNSSGYVVLDQRNIVGSAKFKIKGEINETI